MSPLETNGQTQARPGDYFLISADELHKAGAKPVQSHILLAF